MGEGIQIKTNTVLVLGLTMTSFCMALTASAEDFLDEVLITAFKRAENVQDVPSTINVFTGHDLYLAQIDNTSQLRNLEPRLVFTTNTAFGQPYLRGVGSDLFTPGAEASIATYVDNIYQTRSVSSVQNFFDMERVAVLKGPQGVFFGKILWAAR